MHLVTRLRACGHIAFFRAQKPWQCKIMTFGLIDVGLHYGKEGLKRQLITTVLHIKYKISRWSRASPVLWIYTMQTSRCSFISLDISSKFFLTWVSPDN